MRARIARTDVAILAFSAASLDESNAHTHASTTTAAVVTLPLPTPAPSVSVADQIAGDMVGHREGQPAGWPYGAGAVITQGNNPGSNQAAVQWGVIYVSAAGSSATNTRVNIRSCEIYWLQRSTQTWHLGQKSSTPLIEMYAGNFAWGPTASNSRKEADGTISITPVFGRLRISTRIDSAFSRMISPDGLAFAKWSRHRQQSWNRCGQAEVRHDRLALFRDDYAFSGSARSESAAASLRPTEHIGRCGQAGHT